MGKIRWELEKIASGNWAIQAFDNDEFDPIREIKSVLNEIYSNRIKEDKVHIEALLMDEYFQDIYIDGIKFNLGIQIGIVNFMPYESDGNKYIREVFGNLKGKIK